MHCLKLVLLIVVAGLTACSSDSTSEQFSPPLIPVHAEEVKLQDIPMRFDSLGTLKPSEWVEIRPQASGMLEAVHFTEGQFVTKNTLLFSIEKRPYMIRLNEAEAQLAQDKTFLEMVQKKLTRYHGLSNKELISQQEWDELYFQAAKHEAQLRADEAKVDSARLDLKRCDITASIDGKIGKLLIHSGNLVSAGQATPLATLSNIDRLNVEFTLTEREFQQMSADSRQEITPIEICSYSSPNEFFQAALTFSDHAYDPHTGLLHLRGSLNNPEHQFLPGQHVQVRIPLQVLQGAVVVPQKSVKINQQGPYVFVIKDDRSAELRPVKIGQEFEDQVVVLEGLSPHELIVVEGHLRLSPGLKVDIKTLNGSL